MNDRQQIGLKHLLDKTIMSEAGIQSIANTFSYWCRTRDEYNPRRITLVVWLELNYPENDSEFNRILHANINEIWDKVFNGVKV